jgi:hypothetical protein
MRKNTTVLGQNDVNKELFLFAEGRHPLKEISRMNLYRKNDQNYDPVGTKLAQWSISS